MLASTSMSVALAELIRHYSIERGIIVTASFDAPNELAIRIEDGEVADFFITEDPDRLRELKQQGLLDVYNIKLIAGNRLVLAAGVDSYIARAVGKHMPLAELLAFIDKRTIFVIADADDSYLGKVSEEALEKSGYWQTLEALSVRAANAKEALYLIAKGNSAGIVYASDAAQDAGVKILAEFPEDYHTPIVYQGAVVAGQSMDNARDFLTFLKSERAKAILTKHGFEMR